LYLTLTASRPPTRSSELFNGKQPDYRPVYAERPVRLAHSHAIWLLPAVRTKYLKLPFTTGSSGRVQPLRSLSLRVVRGNHTIYFVNCWV
jgi:hypothetical protein